MIRRSNVRGADRGLLFTVEQEVQADGRRRTLSIKGPIRRHVGQRSSTSIAGRTQFDHGGHLIAHRFGGPGGLDSGNLVPMHGRVNMRGTPWSNMEDAIDRLLGDGRATMRVEVSYRGSDIRPHAFRVEVVHANGMRRTWRIHNFNPHLRPPS